MKYKEDDGYKIRQELELDYKIKKNMERPLKMEEECQLMIELILSLL